MTDQQIRHSEDPVEVLISSRQDPKDEPMSRAQALAIKQVDNYPGMSVRAFEGFIDKGDWPQVYLAVRQAEIGA